ncbi:ABC transporter permease [Parabacteroides sp. AM08-6]|uniref:ABC transporter permease n=1 Tax=Parabacteroides sp. AM08-6 TaxID=2292053 RepID=UPI000EFF4BCC|nr:ABC transporter permease [Parabacteroides sp. AM08-6]RHJ79585.1 hypothetical protein DW103_13435 [Parabacteroides sp. AM08-6]
MFKHYLTIAYRNLLRYKFQSAISIIGLSIGFACFAFCSYLFRFELDYDKNIREVDRIYRAYEKEGQGFTVCRLPGLYTLLSDKFTDIEDGTSTIDVRPYNEKLCEVPADGGKMNYFKEVFLYTDNHFLDFFRLSLLSGNPDELSNLPDAVVISRKAALKLFGTVDAVGRTFTDVNDFHNTREVFTVRGVMEDFPTQSHLEQYSGIILNTSNSFIRELWKEISNNYFKLRKGADLDKLNRSLADFPLPNPLSSNQNATMYIQLKSLLKSNTSSTNGQSLSMPLLFLIIGLLVLLTALFNYVIFIFGQMLNRSKECGIRKVNGCGKSSFFILFFTEACITFLIAGFFCIIFLELFTPVINDFAHNFHFDKQYMLVLMLQYLAGGIVGIALLCWIVTHRLNRLSIIQSLYKAPVIRKKGIVREVLICIQIIICFLFLGSSWFLLQQSKLIETELTAGLDENDKTCLYTVSLNGDKLEAARPEILHKLKENPRIESISLNGMSLLGAWQLGKGYFTWEGITESEESQLMGFLYTDANYLNILKRGMERGRFFTSDEKDKAVINRKLAQQLKNDPIGMQIGIKQRGQSETMTYYEVVGIMPDIINSPNRWGYQTVIPCIYLPYEENYMNMECVVKVRPEYRKTFRKEMEAELHKYVNQATKVYVNNLKESSSFYIEREQYLYKMTSLFSVICILISLLGIYASIRLSTEQRKKEIAIRKINGATQGAILYILSRKNIIQLLLSAAIAFPLLIIITHTWIQNYPLRITIGIIPFLLLFLLMAAIIAFTVIWQITRIARTNPAEAIKTE